MNTDANHPPKFINRISLHAWFFIGLAFINTLVFIILRLRALGSHPNDIDVINVGAFYIPGATTNRALLLVGSLFLHARWPALFVDVGALIYLAWKSKFLDLRSSVTSYLLTGLLTHGVQAGLFPYRPLYGATFAIVGLFVCEIFLNREQTKSAKTDLVWMTAALLIFALATLMIHGAGAELLGLCAACMIGCFISFALIYQEKSKVSFKVLVSSLTIAAITALVLLPNRPDILRKSAELANEIAGVVELEKSLNHLDLRDTKSAASRDLLANQVLPALIRLRTDVKTNEFPAGSPVQRQVDSISIYLDALVARTQYSILNLNQRAELAKYQRDYKTNRTVFNGLYSKINTEFLPRARAAKVAVLTTMNKLNTEEFSDASDMQKAKVFCEAWEDTLLSTLAAMEMDAIKSRLASDVKYISSLNDRKLASEKRDFAALQYMERDFRVHQLTLEEHALKRSPWVQSLNPKTAQALRARLQVYGQAYDLFKASIEESVLQRRFSKLRTQFKTNNIAYAKAAKLLESSVLTIAAADRNSESRAPASVTQPKSQQTSKLRMAREKLLVELLGNLKTKNKIGLVANLKIWDELNQAPLTRSLAPSVELFKTELLGSSPI